VTGAAEQARGAAEQIVDAFGSHDAARYFAAFAPDAAFVFYTEPRVFFSRDQYEAAWRAWEADGFRVLDCRSEDADVRLVTEDVAVMTHAVRTRLAGASEELRERETIVLRREPDGRWLGVHEHLSPEPSP
jgi:uncharacterized protein (TIGR02246 family)